MRKFVLVLLLSIGVIPYLWSENSMVVHLKDGGNTVYPISSIDSVKLETMFVVTVAESPGGKVKLTDRGTKKAVNSGDYVKEGASLTVTTSADAGYERTSINVKSPVVVVSDTTIKAEFSPLPEYVVNVAAVDGGTVRLTCGGEPLNAGDRVQKGKYVVCEIVADNTHFFESVNVFKGQAVRDSFKVSKDTTITPVFSEVTLAEASDKYKVCNYNIRYYNGGQSGDDKGDKAWPNRKGKVFEMIHKHAMDICGIEEITTYEAPDFIKSMSDYEYIGYGRDNGKEYKAGGTGEETGLIYRKAKFVKLDQGRFFLSNTPDKPSKVSGASFNRMVTWVKLKDRQTNDVIFFFATHFDHPTNQTGINTRSKEADIALQIVPDIAGESPMFFVGDFNCRPEEEAYTKLTAVWNDSYITMGDEAQGGYVCNEAQLAQPELAADCACKGNTYTGLYSSTDILPKRIDYVLYNAAFAEPVSYNADNDDLGYTTHPSDHVPVVTEMVIK